MPPSSLSRSKLIGSYLTPAIHLIADDRCDFCGLSGGPLCPPCTMILRPRSTGSCSREAAGPWSSIYTYEPPLKGWILRAKFGREPIILERIAERAVDEVEAALTELDLSPDLPLIFVPIPDPTRRRAARGFNPAALLAELWGRALKIQTRPLLSLRGRARAPQVGRSRLERLELPLDRFKTRGRERNIRGAQIIVIDDVVSTGATLRAARAALKAADAAYVWGLTLAAAPAPTKSRAP
ncbi:MAG: phosphoribosyltransferase family protein [Myxococcota bacterium]|nr:phosphoribosyltransferase family protein [Myxococcota bacterium]